MSISPLAKVGCKARLGKNISIGDFTIIHDNVILGDDVTVESHCVLGYPTPNSDGDPLVIGDRAHIRTHSIFYEGSVFGDDLITGHHVMVREKFKAGKNFQIGTMCDFEGYAEVGDYVRTHSNIHITQKIKIGNFVWIFPSTVFSNGLYPPCNELEGSIVEDYAVIGILSCIMPGVSIGTRSLVGSHSLVKRDVLPDTVVGGVPAKKICMTKDLKMRDGSSAYPWTAHFHRGFPEEIVKSWMKEYDHE
jgi:acetyltransferase-like isoleucine patch superfamily enzyme